MKNKLNDGENARFKIINTLISNKDPMCLYDIKKATNLTNAHILYHLKLLTQKYLVAKQENNYICQPVLLDEDVMDNLYSLLKVMVKTINNEIDLPDEATPEERVECVLSCMEVVVKDFTKKILE